jgi:hypothetical protein
VINHTKLHQGLSTEVVDKHSVGGVNYSVVRLQNSKTDVMYSLHAEQSTFNLSGHITEAHILHRLGFSQGPCAFFPGGQCLSIEIPESFDVRIFAGDISNTKSILREALDSLQACGFYVERQLFGAGGIGPLPQEMLRGARGDGHNASKKQRMKESEDESFKFVLTFIETQNEKGWTIHYIPKHDPVSEELSSILDYLGLRIFAACPEVGFDPCRWRFLRFIPNNDRFHGPAEIVHGWFDSHHRRFSIGISKLLSAEAVVSKHNLHLLPNVKTNVPVEASQPPRRQRTTTPSNRPAIITSTSIVISSYDLAISFAGTQRDMAELVANRVRDAGFDVFYDRFYPEQLWGKDLSVFFDEVFREKARYCLIFVSKEYIERDWTNHERRSAVARMIESKGHEYILPIKVHDVELPGVQPTIGYLSLKDYSIEQIADMVLAKIRT